MTQLSIKVIGADIVRQGLQDLGAEIPQIGRLGIYRTEQAIVKKMKSYWNNNDPYSRPSYVRTGRLAGNWNIEQRTNGYTLINRTPYAKHVHGNAYGIEQAFMHKKGFTPAGPNPPYTNYPGHYLLRDVQDEEIKKLPDEIGAQISAVARRIGFEAKHV